MIEIVVIMIIKPGIYRHYKGKLVEVMQIASHSETLEKMVVYRHTEGDREVWVRPLKMFLETVEISGKRVPRFQYLDK